MPPQQSHSLTVHSNGGLLRVIETQCHVSQAFDQATVAANPPNFCAFKAIWDTGATNSVITQAVVDQCKLAPVGMAQVHGVNSVELSEVYLICLRLPNGVAFPSVRVTKGKIAGTDVLIGMDILTLGDCALTNKDGCTKFSFRVPSLVHVDYVQEHNRRSSGFPRQKPPGYKRFKKNR